MSGSSKCWMVKVVREGGKLEMKSWKWLTLKRVVINSATEGGMDWCELTIAFRGKKMFILMPNGIL